LTVRAYRIAKRKFAGSGVEMMSGRCALRYGGRWNSPGRAVVYASQSLSLATLEVAVHLVRADKLVSYRMIVLLIPDAIILPVDRSALPADWNQIETQPGAVQHWGNAWFDGRLSAVLEVPSVVIPAESNYLINPDHPDFGLIEQGELQDHPFRSAHQVLMTRPERRDHAPLPAHC
jgi:RES domain-containing protein